MGSMIREFYEMIQTPTFGRFVQLGLVSVPASEVDDIQHEVDGRAEVVWFPLSRRLREKTHIAELRQLFSDWDFLPNVVEFLDAEHDAVGRFDAANFGTVDDTLRTALRLIKLLLHRVG